VREIKAKDCQLKKTCGSAHSLQPKEVLRCAAILTDHPALSTMHVFIHVRNARQRKYEYATLRLPFKKRNRGSGNDVANVS
jgi:hypothetical protein